MDELMLAKYIQLLLYKMNVVDNTFTLSRKLHDLELKNMRQSNAFNRLLAENCRLKQENALLKAKG